MLTTLSWLVLPLALVPQQPPADVEAWTEDTFSLIESLDAMHPEPFFGIPRADFELAVDGFLGGLETWSEPQATVEFMRLFARLSRSGREGHAGVWPLDARLLPLQVYGFPDGWFVVAAPGSVDVPDDARLLAIGGVPVDEVVARLAPLICRDNDWNLRTKLAGALTTADLLTGVGVPSAPGGFRLRLRGRDGTEFERVVATQPPSPHLVMQRVSAGLLPARGPARWLRHRDVPFRMELLEPERALYVQYNEVRAAMDGGPTLTEFAAELVATFERERATRVILELRSNGGGDNTTFRPLIEALKTPGIDRPDVLLALIGRHTFSAAGNFVTALQRETNATLVGEPTGGSPNQYGDARTVELPNHPALMVRIATRYHVFSDPDDPRLTHEPDVAVPLTSRDYFEGRDPVLERALHGEETR